MKNIHNNWFEIVASCGDTTVRQLARGVTERNKIVVTLLGKGYTQINIDFYEHTETELFTKQTTNPYDL